MRAVPAQVYINAVATAVPRHDIHQSFVDWAQDRIAGTRDAAIFRRMVDRAGIDHRWSVLPPTRLGGSPVSAGGFYGGASPPTSARMRAYADAAPALALEAIGGLGDRAAIDRVTHLVAASCTGFVAPGLDQIIAARLGLDEGVERTLIGFMGCYAAISALRTAYHIVRSEPGARVLVVTAELSTLHLQYSDDLEGLLAMLQFGDGAAAAIVSAEPTGFSVTRPFATTIPDTGELIRWTIGDTGFAMHLSGAVAGRIAAALQQPAVTTRIFGDDDIAGVDAWAVHAGGRSILDAVERAFNLRREVLDASRDVLSRYGNMSSSTLMFALASLLNQPERRKGVALAFGPGLAAEGFHFERAA